MNPAAEAALAEVLGWRLWLTPDDAVNKCSIATNELLGALLARGGRGDRVELRGQRDLSRRHRDAVEPHTVALIDGEMIDLTALQFDTFARVPTRYGSIGEVGRDWQQYRFDRTPAEEWRDLPPT